jgi:hypothetical protein
VANENEIMDALREAIEFGPGEAMRRNEIAKGGTLVPTGSVDWLPHTDWIEDMVVSRVGDDVRIVAIQAKEPGSGAFSRLITALAKRGLRPIVVCPFSHMEEILRRWKWRRKDVGIGFDDREDQWTPRSTWLKKRAARAT